MIAFQSEVARNVLWITELLTCSALDLDRAVHVVHPCKAHLQADGGKVQPVHCCLCLLWYLALSYCRYDVSGRCSCQLACYPGKGARYVRHTDASDSAPDRSVTALLYLNPVWDVQVGPSTTVPFTLCACVVVGCLACQ